MKQLYAILILTLIIHFPLLSQEATGPKFVRKAAYFDKTPPLSEMKVIMPGERQRAWKDGVIKNESVEMRFKNNFTPTAGTYANIQSEQGRIQSRGPVVNFEGIPNVNGVYPPDTDGAVGPDHYMQMINLSFAIWDKEGNKIFGPVDNSTLWDGFVGPWTGSNDGDPIVLYDSEADRFVASQFAIQRPNGKSYELVAVSATGDPLGEWYRYAFEFDDFNDYPKLGVWSDAYYCTFNFFSGGFIGGGVAAFERDKMLVGDPDANMVFFGYFQSKYSLQPADFEGQLPPEGTPNFIATVNTFSNQQFEIYEFDVDWENPENSTYQLGVSIDPGFFNPSLDGIPQPGTSNRLDALSQMLMYRLAYRNFGTYESMVANHTVNVGGNRAGIKWYEFRKQGTENWSIYQQGVYAPNDDLHRWMGSIAINAEGTIALGYSVSGTNKSPSIRYTGRPADAPLGEMTYQEIEAFSGTGAQTSFSRWGDYAKLVVDPVDDTTFWFTTEYTRGGWKTRVVAFDFSPLQPPTAYAGEDSSVCQDTVFRVMGQVTNAKTHIWSTSGDGLLPNPEDLWLFYFRGQQDLINGEFWVTLTAEGYEPGLEDSDSIRVEIVYRATAFAGNDTTIQANAVYQANAEATDFSSVMWETSGDGTFDDNTTLNAVYTPGTSDIAAGSATLTVYAAPLAPCSYTAEDNIVLTIEPVVGVTGRMNSDRLSIVPNPTSGQFTIDFNGESANAELSIINPSGENIFTQVVSGKTFSRNFDFRYQPKGIYLIQISSGSQTYSGKVLIQ
jgi:hypothetical protein